MWIRRKMEEVKWYEKILNAEIFRRVEEDQKILVRKRNWIGDLRIRIH